MLPAPPCPPAPGGPGLHSRWRVPHRHCSPPDTPGSPPRACGKSYTGNLPCGSWRPKGPRRRPPALGLAIPLASKLGLGQDVRGQGVQARLQQRTAVGEGLCGTEPLGASPIRTRGMTHHVLHGHAAGVAQLLDDMGSGTLPVGAERCLSTCSGPQGTYLPWPVAWGQPQGSIGSGRDSPPAGPGPLPTVWGPAQARSTAGPCRCPSLSPRGGGWRLREILGLSPKSCGTICRQR